MTERLVEFLGVADDQHRELIVCRYLAATRLTSAAVTFLISA